MKIKNLVFENIHSILIENGFTLTEELNLSLTYKLGIVIIKLVFNPRENSNTLWVGRIGSNNIEVDNHLIEKFYCSELKLSNLSQDTFIKNVLLFLLGPGKNLLNGKNSELVKLENFNRQRSKDYTDNLSNKQSLLAAENAWNKGNYAEVIRLLKMLDENSLSESSKKKYKIARKRLEN